MTHATSVFTQSRFSWVKDLPPGRNQFVSFGLRFSLPAAVPAIIYLFADTRYRLWVNDVFVAYGPGRFVTAHPEYDSHDLIRLLRAGENFLRVEVNFYGASSFQTMPDGVPGFIAAGGTEDGSVSFATPGAWKALIHRAWDAESPAFSFAQNPTEICDTRVLADELAAPFNATITTLAGKAVPWATPTPRSAPYPDYSLASPARLLASGPLEEPLRWGMQIRNSRQMEAWTPSGPFIMFSTWVHSPRAQNVTLDCFWADLEVNGRVVTIGYPKRFGNQGQAHISLGAGWNFLGGKFGILAGHWPFLLGLPRESEVSLHALPDLKCRETFAISPLAENCVVPPSPPSHEGYAPPADWTLIPNDLAKVTPARLTAWDTPVSSATQYDVPKKRFPEVATHTAHAATWSFDFSDEYYGHPVLEVEAPPGSILDIAYDDWKRADGCVALYNSNPFTDAADRFILRGGRQRIDVLNPRGGIYLQVILRVPFGTEHAPLSVHEIAVRRRTTIKSIGGAFSCGDGILDWSWRTSVHTLQASTDEAYSDCPWRERGSYIGDSLVNLHLNRLASADLSVAKRTLAVMGQAELPDGLLPGCAPAWLRKPHEDFTLLWILAVRDVWAYTGDTDFISRQWPIVQGIWKSSKWKKDADGLWDSTGMRVFIDWGAIRSECEGAGNGAMNIWRIASARACAEMAAALNLDKEKGQFLKEADKVSATLMKKLWNKAEGRFNGSVGATTPAVHANILALLYGLGPAEEILEYLEPKLHQNFAWARNNGDASGYAELYFFFYLLPALAAQGRYTLAESLIREHYGFLRLLGYPTLTEGFIGADLQQGSCCHSWSGAPAMYVTQNILGLRQAEPGQPDVYLLNPVSPAHQRAEGALPHRHGLITVKWQRAGERIRAQAKVPKGVTLRAAAHVDLSIA
jgi:alpha-L-rhamnosidase